MTAISALPLFIWLKSTITEYNGTNVNLFIGLMLKLTGIVPKLSVIPEARDLNQITDKDLAFTGFARGFSILSGISRSGVTIVSLLAYRMEQETALTILLLLNVSSAMGAV